MKNCLVLAFIITGAILAACSSSKTPTTSTVWVNKDKVGTKSYHRVFIVVMTADIETRVQLENDLAAVAESRGYEAVKSYDSITFSLDRPKAPTREEVINSVRASGADAVFVASLLKKDEELNYTPGTTAYSQGNYYSWNGQVFGYYSNWYPTVSTPDYYSHDKKYFMQSNLYDVASEELLWSVKSQVFNPASLKKFSKTYTSDLITQLEDQKILKK